MLTTVYPYNEKPMMCGTCQRYGHTKKRCTAEHPSCSWCSGKHTVQRCDKESTPPKCVNCAQPHGSLNAQCEVRCREFDILEIQRKYKVERWQAVKIRDGKGDQTEYEEAPTYQKYVYVGTDAALVRKTCPFQIERYLQRNFGIQREDIMTERNGLVINTSSPEQAYRSSENRKYTMHSVHRQPY